MSQKIGKYRIIRLLGQGGMGRVFLAQDPFIGRQVAVKIMTTAAPKNRERFLHEARIVGKLSHPNIVILYDFGLQGTQPYLVMEFLEGVELQSWMQDPRPLKEKARIMGGLCKALAYAHAHDVLHRDIKPGNVQVLPDGTCKLMDFGIARGHESELTASGTILGTPLYMAPEILANSTYSAQSDIYSLGVLFYELLCGINPFRAVNLQACLYRVINHHPTPLEEACPELPRELARSVMGCIEKNPSHRPENLNALTKVIEHLPLAEESDAPPVVGTSEVLPLSPSTLTLDTANREILTGDAFGAEPRKRILWPVGLLAVGLIAAIGFLANRTHSPGIDPAPPGISRAGSTKIPGISGDPFSPIAREGKSPTASPAASPPSPSPSASPTDRVAAARALETERPARHVPRSRSMSPTPSQPPTPPPTPKPWASKTPAPTKRVPTPPLRPTRRPSPVATPRLEPTPGQAAPVLERIHPNAARRGRSVKIKVQGRNLREGLVPRFFRGNRPTKSIRIRSVKFIDSTQINLVLAVERNAPLGSYVLILADKHGKAINRLLLDVNL